MRGQGRTGGCGLAWAGSGEEEVTGGGDTQQGDSQTLPESGPCSFHVPHSPVRTSPKKHWRSPWKVALGSHSFQVSEADISCDNDRYFPKILTFGLCTKISSIRKDDPEELVMGLESLSSLVVMEPLELSMVQYGYLEMKIIT